MHGRLGEDRGERALHQREDADDVAALGAREREVVDVEDREVGAPGEQELRRVGAAGRRADAEVNALGLVIAAAHGGEDAGVHAVGREVEQQRRVLVGAVLAAPGAAPGERERRGRSDQRRDLTEHPHARA